MCDALVLLVSLHSVQRCGALYRMLHWSEIFGDSPHSRDHLAALSPGISVWGPTWNDYIIVVRYLKHIGLVKTDGSSRCGFSVGTHAKT